MLCRVHSHNDWTAVVVPEATLADLDPRAIELAREGYKQQHPKFADECDSWSDTVFLDKASLTIGGKITRTTLLLVGKKESAHLLPHISQIVWKCFQDGEIFGDIYTIPYILSTTELLGRIRNYRFKIYPKDSLIPAEVWKYDTESILEGMHNAIAHQLFEANERIIVTEDKDKLLFQNAGSFFDGKVEDYIEGTTTSTRYRNPALVKAMVNIKMIDSQGYGIHKMYVSQQKRFLPMPDYLQSTDTHVILHIPGTVINEDYSLILLENRNLMLADAVLLDRVQKGKRISHDAVARLRKMHLIEGRMPNLFVSKPIAHAIDQKVEYSKHKGLDTKGCEALLLQALKDHGSLKKAEVVELLLPILSDQLNDAQKKNKIKYILLNLKKQGIITNESSGPNSLWKLSSK